MCPSSLTDHNGDVANVAVQVERLSLHPTYMYIYLDMLTSVMVDIGLIDQRAGMKLQQQEMIMCPSSLTDHNGDVTHVAVQVDRLTYMYIYLDNADICDGRYWSHRLACWYEVVATDDNASKFNN